MKKYIFLICTFVTISSSQAFALDNSSRAFVLNASILGDLWNGLEVPQGQQCQKFGGDNPASPTLLVSNIPATATALVMEYSDRDYERMNGGGHGKVSFALETGTKEIEVPSVPGHSYDLPEGFTMVAAHLGPNWDKEGAYMPPCSGGKGHAYYVTVKAVNGEEVLAKTTVEMGLY